MLKRSLFLSCVLAGAVMTSPTHDCFAAENPFVGAWALTIPGGHAGWLGVTEKAGGLQASMLWGWGSVEPVFSAKLAEGKLVLERKHNLELKEGGKTIKTNYIETITATVAGDRIELVSRTPRLRGGGEDVAQFSGRRQPPLPPAPDLSKVKFGAPVRLFNGQDLSGWRLTDPGAVNGWRAVDGVLVNDPVQEEGKPHKNYGNLRTEKEFEDFNLQLEVRLPEKGNSGIYLRGIYEIQVADSFGKPASAHGMGAIYSRVAPTANPSKAPGEWQTLDITLVDRHVTVLLNGQKILDNVALEGCTGGALWSDVTRPGPLYLQGDHTRVEYRNMVLRPRVQ